MRKLIAILVTLAVCGFQTSKATDISADITSNTVWNAAGSPYIITAPIAVNHGVTLTVQTGVTVKFNDGLYMIVNGTLNATSATFTSNNASPAPGIWSYIQVGSGGTNDTGYVSMSSCQIQYAQTFHVYKGRAVFSGTSLLNFDNDGVLVEDGCRFKMTGGSINTNSSTAASFYSGISAQANSNDTISGVTIQHFKYGIYLKLNAVFDMTSTTVSACDWPIYYEDAASLTVHGTNTLSGNTNPYVRLAMGTVSVNFTLPALSIPYSAGSVTVNHGITMTVPSGTSYRLDAWAYLYIYGHFTASNTTFTSINGSPASGDWQYIQVGSSTPADSGLATLTGCTVNYSSWGIYVLNGKAVLSSTNLLNSYYEGLSVEAGGILKMTGGSINTNSATALASYAGINAKAGSDITVSTFTIQNYRYGIYLGNNAKVDMTNNNITNCTYPIYYSASADVTVHGTINLAGNTNTFIYMDFTTLTDTLTLPVLSIPYEFSYYFTVNSGARLVIGDNNIIKFPNGTALDIYGTLVANASVGKAIYFTSLQDDNWGGDTNNDGTASSPNTGDWIGVRFFNSSLDASCVMRRCQLRYAGYGNVGGINTQDASPTIDYCNLEYNYYGIYLEFASNPTISNNTIGSSSMTPIAMSFEANPVMSNNVLSFSDNAYDAIGLLGGTLTANATIKKRNVTTVNNITYLLLSQVLVPSGKTLTINKGIVIKSYHNGHRIVVEGTLTANATVDSMIVFTSAMDDNYGNPADCNKDGTITNPAIGDWGGITFNGGGGTLNYCRIKYARNNYWWWYGFPSCSTTQYLLGGGVETIDASPTISNCDFNNLDYGIVCHRVSNPAISNNSMTNITYVPFAISSPSNPAFTGNTFTNVGWTAIGLLGGNVCQNGTIKKRNVAGYTNISYILLGDMTIDNGTSINTEAGVVIKMNACNIYVDGGFKTDGLAGSKVTFTSIKDDNVGNPFDTNGDGNATTPAEDDWGCIKFRSASNDAYCKLNYTNLYYGGSTDEGTVSFENAGGQINNSLISNSSNYGVYCNGNSNPPITTLTIQNCSKDPIAMSLTSNPTFTNITFISNFSNAIKIIEGTLSSNATLAPRSLAGISNIAYIISALTISSNAKLTIQPGVVLKFRIDDWCGWWSHGPDIVVYGNLIAKGTASNKIYFTSFADDSRGGDSNNDGNATSPAAGDWGQYSYGCNDAGGIKIINNSTNADTVNHFKYCEFSYPGTAFRIENSHATIDSTEINLCSEHGITVLGSANPDIKNTGFNNIASTPVNLSMFSNPTFTNCTASNIGLMALGVVAETYSQTDTVPVRNFAGYSNISYYIEGKCTINTGTTITIPAGVVFKSNATDCFEVNGRLDINGTSGSPVIFTDYRDDRFGNPADMNQDGPATVPPDGISWGQGWSGNSYITFNNVSDDLSSLQYSKFYYLNTGIKLISASPTINYNQFDNLYTGIDMSGVSQPKIDNSTFNDLKYCPIQISLVSFPSSYSNNLITGTSYKVIRVRDETLTQDATISKRNFGGVTNIPYLFGTYTVGTSAILTINPGIVCKFIDNEGWKNITINVNKGLNAQGGSRADSNIVFTDLRDDFYGGDSNADSSLTSPVMGRWTGLVFENVSIDAQCKLKNCIIRYADKGITTNSASPTVTKCNINHNNYGVYATASSNPVFSYCDFDDNYYWSIDNVNKAFTINAENCWWGSNLGPIQTNTPGNGTSVRELVTTAVDFTPFLATGATAPVMGDVSLNGIVQAYDASLILQYVVDPVGHPLTAAQQAVADVTFNGAITSYDASYILQYVVGLVQFFPAETLKLAAPKVLNAQLAVGSATVPVGSNVTIPLNITDASGMTSSDIKLHYDPAYLQVVDVVSAVNGMNLMYSNDPVNGIITIAMAGTNQLNDDLTLANITFNATAPGSSIYSTNVEVVQFFADETDLTSLATPGIITIDGTTGVNSASGNYLGMDAVYPNPSSENAVLTFHTNAGNQQVKIEVYNMTGQKVVSIVENNPGKGKHTVSLSSKENKLDYGAYVVRMTTEDFSQTQRFQIVK